MTLEDDVPCAVAACCGALQPDDERSSVTPSQRHQALRQMQQLISASQCGLRDTDAVPAAQPACPTADEFTRPDCSVTVVGPQRCSHSSIRADAAFLLLFLRWASYDASKAAQRYLAMQAFVRQHALAFDCLAHGLPAHEFAGIHEQGWVRVLGRRAASGEHIIALAPARIYGSSGAHAPGPVPAPAVAGHQHQQQPQTHPKEHGGPEPAPAEHDEQEGERPSSQRHSGSHRRSWWRPSHTPPPDDAQPQTTHHGRRRWWRPSQPGAAAEAEPHHHQQQGEQEQLPPQDQPKRSWWRRAAHWAHLDQTPAPSPGGLQEGRAGKDHHGEAAAGGQHTCPRCGALVTVADGGAQGSVHLRFLLWLVGVVADHYQDMASQGVLIIESFEGWSWRHLLPFGGGGGGHSKEGSTSPSFAQCLGFLRECVPLRMKGLLAVRDPPGLGLAWAVVRRFMGDKLASRVRFLGNDVEALHRAVGSRDVVPACLGFGGTNPDCGEDWWRRASARELVAEG